MEEKKISIDKEILKTIEHTANIAAMTGSRKNYGIYISTISSLSNVLTVKIKMVMVLDIKRCTIKFMEQLDSSLVVVGLKV